MLLLISDNNKDSKEKTMKAKTYKQLEQDAYCLALGTMTREQAAENYRDIIKMYSATSYKSYKEWINNKHDIPEYELIDRMPLGVLFNYSKTLTQLLSIDNGVHGMLKEYMRGVPIKTVLAGVGE